MNLKKNNKSGLLLIVGIMIFILISSVFIALGFILPSQVSSSLEEEMNERMLPDIRSALEKSNHSIKLVLDKKRDTTLARVKKAYATQNEAKGKAIIKTILPLVENYDFETVKQILVDAVESDGAIAGIHYRLQSGDKLEAIGDTSSSGLLPFKTIEKNNFADVEITLLISPKQLAQAEEEEKNSFIEIEQHMKQSNQKLEQQIHDNAVTMQSNTIGSMRTQVWLFAVVGVVLLISITLLVMQRLVIIPLNRTRQHLLTLSKGDLTQDFDYHSKNELGEMADAMNIMVENLRRIVTEINSSLSTLTNHTDSLNNNTSDVVQGAQNQAAQAEQAASAITDLSSSFNEVANSSNSASKSASSASQQAKIGRDLVSKTATGMNTVAAKVSESSELIDKLNRRTEEIGNVVNVINGIAEQTNLLALNAAIEAARAGEQGRGFAVVADEVRTLASRTQESTQEIQQMIESLQAGTKAAVGAMDSSRAQAQNGVEKISTAGDALTTIVAGIEHINDMNTQIASAALEQSAVAEEVNKNVVNISQIASTSEANSVQTQNASEELSRFAVGLQSLVSQFKS
ncbi:MAG: HAMP domain-containing methyl-accepting chemotaxis protein [Gammaproteobacteria bacterium]|nr:HAMP domain-containing methyl-accepting chemotaxis protein [Gammaproteobacteria bacterium]